MHHWIFGMPGTGKTTALINDFLDAIAAGEGGIFIDPIGSAVDTILRRFPKSRVNDCLIIDPTDTKNPVGWNILDRADNKPFMAEMLKDTIKALWDYEDIPTPVMDRMIYNTLAALLETREATLLCMEPMLTDKAYRTRVLENVSDPFLLRKWAYWGTKSAKDWDQLVASTENKAGEFSEDPRIRNIIGQHRSSFDLKDMLFRKQVILLRLPISQLGHKATLFGSLFLAHLQAVAFSRKIHIPAAVVIDNCHLFDTPVLRHLLERGLPHGISLHVSNQYLAQLSRELRSSLLANCEKRTMFRTGIEDSEYLHKTIPYDNTNSKLHELSPHNALIFDGTLQEYCFKPTAEGGNIKRAQMVVAQSRRTYGSPRIDVEEQIARFIRGL